MFSLSDFSFGLVSSSSAIKGFTLLLVGLTYAIYTRAATPLRKIPGPFLASITTLWIFQQQRGLQRQKLDIDLHKKYGPIVRISPHEVMVSSPKSLKTVYAVGSKFPKGDWYQATGNGGWSGPDNFSLLSETNMEKYRVQRRVTGPAYTESYIKEIEGNLDTILEKNLDVMRGRLGKGVDADIFFNFFALDCLSMLTFSTPKGIVEANEDDGSISAIHNMWKYTHLVGFFPWIHRFNLWFFNVVVKYWASWTKFVPRFTAAKKEESIVRPDNVFVWASKQLQHRLALKEKDPSQSHTDITSKLFQIQSEKEALKDHWLAGMVLTNFGAGIETTAITISALMCNIISSPGCQEKVQTEIDAAVKAGKLSKTPKLRELQESLPYLNACISESMRLHPIVGMPFMRIVPEGGTELEGYFIPAGTTVGIDPWVLSRDKSLYGEDADEWRPERWLEYSPAQIRNLEAYSMSFGMGSRSCPGKYVAQAIYTKMIPMLFMNFDWSFVDPKAERRTKCTFPIRLVDVMIQWKARE